MPTNAIVKAGNVLKDGTTSLLMGLKDVTADTFVFEGAEEPLHHGIVVTIASTTHTHLNAPGV
jgi:hypothetical protein